MRLIVLLAALTVASAGLARAAAPDGGTEAVGPFRLGMSVAEAQAAIDTYEVPLQTTILRGPGAPGAPPYTGAIEGRFLATARGRAPRPAQTLTLLFASAASGNRLVAVERRVRFGDETPDLEQAFDKAWRGWLADRPVPARVDLDSFGPRAIWSSASMQDYEVDPRACGVDDGYLIDTEHTINLHAEDACGRMGLRQIDRNSHQTIERVLDAKSFNAG